MEFGYFFLGIEFSPAGIAAARVEIRPMAADMLQRAGARVTIKVPLRTSERDLSVAQVAALALQAAQELLPESALQAWGQRWAGEPMTQPCLPGQALQDWLNPVLDKHK